MKSPSLRLRLILLMWAGMAAGALLYTLAGQAWLEPLRHAMGAPWPGGADPALVLSVLLGLLLAVWAVSWALEPLQRMLRALEGAVLSYQDGDFSSSLHAEGGGELAQLLRLHRDMGSALREQRQHLAQRELLLDSLVQNTPVALLLVNDRQEISFGNLAARQLLAEGRSLQARPLQSLLDELPAALGEALRSEQDQLFSIATPEGEESFHFSQRQLSLLGQPHRLILLRRMTRELSRQEVASWKRVIRVISHELNNSLAPISSLSHSGAELARRGQLDRLPQVFDSIGGRARHLHSFLDGYARFAKLPQPRPEPLDWTSFVNALAGHVQFHLERPLPQEPARLDAAQLEQALINLLKNAHEAGGPADAISLGIQATPDGWLLQVQDRGPGMSPAVLAQALLPFYSTKRSGTGLGLALAREIAEAHGGRISLANREGGGLSVTLNLPR